MSNRGIVEFYYSEELPVDSIALAKIVAQDYNPSQMVSISSSVYQQGSLSLTKSTTQRPVLNPDFQAPALNQTISFNGDTVFYVGNQFFQITDVIASDNTPLYYRHKLPNSVQSAAILDGTGVNLVTPSIIYNNYLYHDLPDGYYQVRYVDSDGFVSTEMLDFNLAYTRASYSPSSSSYLYVNSVLTLASNSTRYIRWTQPNGYIANVPYGSPSNSPWFLRLSYGLTPTPPEWSKQVFIPQLPYLLASWVPGTIINTSVIQLERKNAYYDPDHLPDILVFDKDNNIKYALDGTSIYIKSTKGYEYPWKRGLIKSFDPYSCRMDLNVTLEPTDLVFGFYSYAEQDIIYTDLDVNPFTNPSVRNSLIQLYVKTDGANPLKFIYYSITDSSGTLVQTNDLAPTQGTSNVFATIGIGVSISARQLDVTDVRTRGGGLAAEYEDIPQASNFWDLGYLDGKPYPAAGTLIIYLPYATLSEISRDSVTSKIQSILPLGLLAVVRYYDKEGNEYV